MVGEAVSQFGRLDILVNCAGAWAVAACAGLTSQWQPAGWQVRASRPHRRCGRCSICASFLPSPGNQVPPGLHTCPPNATCPPTPSVPAAGNFLSPAEQLSANGFRTVMEIDTFGTFHMWVPRSLLLPASQRLHHSLEHSHFITPRTVWLRLCSLHSWCCASRLACSTARVSSEQRDMTLPTWHPPIWQVPRCV